jgi:putative tryptophan/tyrosine transport system substrate-binding protein
MRRRDFVASTAAVATLSPMHAIAQSKLPMIGYFSSRSEEAEVPMHNPFLAGLRQAGFTVGRDVVVQYRFANGRRDLLPMFAAQLAGLRPAVLVATEHGAAVAAKAATASIPIVFTSGLDPVQAGLVASLRRPGGNATGVSLFTSELGPKRLGLLREILPRSGLIAFLADPASPSSALQIGEAEAAAQTVGQPLLVLQAGNLEDADKAFATMAEHGVVGLLYGASTVFQALADRLIALAARYQIPALYEWRELVTAGGLISYSTSRTEVGSLVGDYVGRILHGAAPAELPILQSARFELVVNLKTAGALGLNIPQSILARADEVIE